MRPGQEPTKYAAKGAHTHNWPSRLFLLLLPIFIISTPLHAARTSYTGLSGLPFMNTADTVGRRELDIHFREGAEKFEQEGVVDHVGRSALGVTYGLYDGLEVAAQLPHSYKEGRGYSGVPYFTIAGKYRFLGGRNKPYALAVSAVGNVGASDIENNIGSGENGYSLELNASLYAGSKVAAHIMLGREKSDRKSFRFPTPLPATSNRSINFESVTKNKLAVGFEYEMDPDLFLSMEAEGTVTTDDEDDNGILSLGLRYQADTALSYVMGIGFGLPDERSQPQIRALAGIAYSYGKPHAPTRAEPDPAPRQQSRAAPQPRPVQIRPSAPPGPGYVYRDGYWIKADIHDVPAASTLPATRARQPARKPARRTVQRSAPQPRVRKPVARPKVKRTVQKPRPKPAPRKQYVSEVKIEVWNASGVKGLGRKVADRLKQKGYRVVRVKAAKRLQKQSMVFYTPGYSKQAVKIGHAIWKDQNVRGTSKLKKDIQVQIVVGYDLKDKK